MKAEKNIISKLFLPMRRGIWLRRARKFYSARRYSDAAIWCEMTLEIDRNCAEAKEMRKKIKTAAVKRAESVASEENESSPNREMDAVFWLIESKRPRQAGIIIRRAIRRHWRDSPDKPLPEWLRVVRAEAAYLEDDFQAAYDELKELRDSGQFGAEATYYSALCRLATGERHRALALLGGFLSKHPWFIEARFEEALEESEASST